MPAVTLLPPDLPHAQWHPPHPQQTARQVGPALDTSALWPSWSLGVYDRLPRDVESLKLSNYIKDNLLLRNTDLVSSIENAFFLVKVWTTPNEIEVCERGRCAQLRDLWGEVKLSCILSHIRNRSNNW